MQGWISFRLGADNEDDGDRIPVHGKCPTGEQHVNSLSLELADPARDGLPLVRCFNVT